MFNLATKKNIYIKICVSFVEKVVYRIFRESNIFHPLLGLESQPLLPVLLADLLELGESPRLKGKREQAPVLTVMDAWSLKYSV